MSKLFPLLLAYFVKAILWFRYRVTIKGLDKLNKATLPKSGGILFLPNHPTIFVDPSLVGGALWRRFEIRPVIVEYMFYTPIVNWFMHRMRALSIPDFSVTSNSIKRRKSERALDAIVEAVKHGDNFIVYPAGHVKRTAYERIGGTSAVHSILQRAPEANVVLVRTKGLWGSSFSRALTGKTPLMFPTIFRGVKIALKNLLFFTPRREVTIEFVPADPDFPYSGSKLELNRYLEEWYNRPDGLVDNPPDYRGESLVLVPYSMWSKKLPTVAETASQESMETALDVSRVPEKVRQHVINEIAEMAQCLPDHIQSDMNLSADLGFDSLDIANVASFLEDHYGVSGVRTQDITTVGKVMSLAARQVKVAVVEEEERPVAAKWARDARTGPISLAEGHTIIEVFLRNCDRMGSVVAGADGSVGVLTYRQMKMRVILLARIIRKIPGKYVGVMFPASVAADIVILACQLAGKVPLMINWTVGKLHLESVVNISGVSSVLSAWSFVDRLENVEFGPLDDMMIMLEDFKKELTIVDKIAAMIVQHYRADAILSLFDAKDLSASDEAVVLFTSGTESMPKGVPLTHHNILSNHRAALESISIHYDDILFGILPPFHSFGFSVTTLLPLLTGVKVICYPDPTDGQRLAREIQRWGVTIVCSAPTFLKGILKAAKPSQLRTVHLFISGAETAPPELSEMVAASVPHAILTEGYGITECSPVLTLKPPGVSRPGVGPPLPGVELCVIHPESHEPLTICEEGLILARGPNVFSGYMNGGVKSPFLTIDGKQWYNTGDLGFLDDEGFLVISGRLKRFVKVGGEMISLAAIEHAILQAAPSQGWHTKEEGPSLAICAREVPGMKTRIVLFATFETTLEDVNKALRVAGFSNVVKVTDLEVLKDIPVMGTGKINYRELEAQYFS